MPDLVTTLAASEADRLLQAEALVRAFCGWHISPSRTETVVVRGRGGNLLLLPSLHVTAIESITDGETTLVVDDNYFWTVGGVVTNLGSWGFEDITIEMTHGYAADALPKEITAVAQAVAQRAMTNPGSLVQETAGPFSTRYAGSGATLELLGSEKEILRPYRIPGVA